MKFFNNLKFNQKILMVLGLSLVVMSYFAVLAVENRVNAYRNATQVTDAVVTSIQTQAILRELYKEAGISALYLTDNSIEVLKQLTQQRVATDQAIADAQGLFQGISLLANIRGQVQTRELPFQRIYQAIDQLGQSLLAKTLSLRNFSVNSRLTQPIQVATHIAELEAQAGRQLALFSNVFAQDGFANASEFQNVTQTIAAQLIYQTEFSRWATPEQNQLFAAIVTGSPVVLSRQLRQTALDYPRGIIPGADAQSWYSAQSGTLALLANVSDTVSNNLLNAAQLLVQQTSNALIFMSALLGLVIVITVALTFKIVNRVNHSLQQITDVAKAIAQGKYDTHIDHIENDEAGAVVKILAGLRSHLRQRLTRENTSHLEQERIRVALTGAQDKIMLTDNDFKITYINQALVRLFKTHEASLQVNFPNFKASNVIGRLLNDFFKNPDYQHKVLRRLRTTHKEQLVFADVQFELIMQPMVNSAGERLGIMIEWVNLTDQLSENCKEDEARRLLAEQAECLSKITRGDLTATMVGTYHEPNHQYAKESLNKALRSMNNILKQTGRLAQDVDTQAVQLQRSGQTLVLNTEQQANAAKEVSAVLQQTNEQAREIAEHAHRATEVVLGVTRATTYGQEKMQSMTQAITQLADSSYNVESIIKVIDEIAFQTNLLALNASVEAARVGHGQEFVTVAKEVRNLATRSAKVAKESAEQIGDATQRVLEGLNVAKETEMALDGIVQSVTQVKDIMTGIAESNVKHIHGSERINAAMRNLFQCVEGANQHKAQLSSSASTLTETIKQLQHQISRVKLTHQKPDVIRTNVDLHQYTANTMTLTPRDVVTKEIIGGTHD